MSSTNDGDVVGLQSKVKTHLQKAAKLEEEIQKESNLQVLNVLNQEYEKGLEAMVALLKLVDPGSSLYSTLKSRARSVWERLQQLKELKSSMASKELVVIQSPTSPVSDYGQEEIRMTMIPAKAREQAESELRERDCDVLIAVEPAALYSLMAVGSEAEPELLVQGRLHILRAVVDARVLGQNYSGIWHINKEGTLASLVFLDLGQYQIPLTTFIPVVRNSRQHFLFPTAVKDQYWILELPLRMSDEELDSVENVLADHCVLRRSYGYEKWRRDRDGTARLETAPDSVEALPEIDLETVSVTDDAIAAIAQGVRSEYSEKEKNLDADSNNIMAEFQTSVSAESMFNMLNSLNGVKIVDIANAIRDSNQDKLLQLARESGMEDVVEAVRNHDFEYVLRKLGDAGVDKFLKSCNESGVPALMEAVKNVDVEGLRNNLKTGNVRGVIQSVRDSNLGGLYAAVLGVQRELPGALLENFNYDSFLQFARNPSGYAREKGTSGAMTVASALGHNMLHPDEAYGKPLQLLAGSVHQSFDAVEGGVELASGLIMSQMDATCDFLKAAVGTSPANIKLPMVVKLPFKMTAKVTPVARLLSNALVGGLANFAAGVILVIKGVLSKTGIIGDNSLLQNASRSLYSGADASAGVLFGVARTLVALETAGRNIAAHFGDKVVEMANWGLGEDAGEIARDCVEITRDVSMTTYNLYAFSFSSVLRGAAKGAAKGAVKQSAKAMVANYYFQIKKQRAAEREAEKIRRFVEGSEVGQYIEQKLHATRASSTAALRMLRGTSSSPVIHSITAPPSATASSPQLSSMTTK